MMCRVNDDLMKGVKVESDQLFVWDVWPVAGSQVRLSKKVKKRFILSLHGS